MSDHYSSPALLVGIAVLCLCAAYVYSHLSSPLHSVPGPFLARITRLWYVIHARRGLIHKDQIELHKKYGKVVRISPNEYSLDDPEAVKIVYPRGTSFRKSDFYTAFAPPGVPNIFSTTDEGLHAHMRKHYHPLYTMSALTTYESYVDDCVLLLSQRFKEMARSGERVNMSHWLRCFAFDLIGSITFSQRFGFLDEGQDVSNLMRFIDSNMKYGVTMGILSEFHEPFFKAIAWLSRTGLTGKPATLYLRQFSQMQWDKRNQEFEKEESAGYETTQDVNAPKDFLTKLIEQHLKDPEAITKTFVLSGCNANVVAGSDTTSATLSGVFYYMLKAPKTLQKLRQEIREHEKADTISDPVTFKESQRMEYLQAVLKEGLRLNPAVSFSLARVVPEGGAQISDHFFHARTVVGINPHVAHRNKDVWGPDADEFRPERWLKSHTDEVTLARMEHYFMPFGLGGRNCMGRHISFLEMNKMVPQIVRKCDFELDDHLKNNEWETKVIWILHPQNFYVKVKNLGEDAE